MIIDVRKVAGKLIVCVIYILFAALTIYAQSQDKPSYKIFDIHGKEIKFKGMMDKINKKQIILFGELHNNPIAHWLELQILKEMHQLNPALVVGFEMFEADNQMILDEYSKGLIQEKNFSNEARVWNNFETDYLPLLEYCGISNVKMIATNIPRRYANLVYRKGGPALDSLSGDAKTFIAPLPFPFDLDLPGYKKLAEEVNFHTSGKSNNQLALSQAIKDATMAHFIIKNFKGNFLHFNGSYHSHNFEGIVWYLKAYQNDAKLLTIETVEQQNIDALEKENHGVADILIVIPSDMTKTY